MHHASLFKLMLSFLCVPNNEMNIRHFEWNTNISKQHQRKEQHSLHTFNLTTWNFTQFWDKVGYLFILLVGGAINSLKPNKASKFNHWDRYPTLMIYGGLYRDNRVVPILYWSQY
jgi:hypothetical protein